MEMTIEEKERTINFYIIQAEFLASELEEQDQSLVASLGDYFTEDIANEWNWNKPDQNDATSLVNENLVDKEYVNLYKEICDNFTNASIGKPLYDEKIWTLKGLEEHPFWEEQRRLAKELLDILNKVEFKCQ